MPTGSRRSISACITATLALFMLSEALTGAPCRTAPELHSAESMMRNGQFRQAIDKLIEVQKTESACDPELYHLLAIAYLNTGASGKAIDSAEKGVTMSPQFVPAQEYYISVLRYSLPEREAAKRLEVSANALPKAFILRRALGEMLLDLNPQSERAGVLLSECVRERPGDIESRGNYAKWLCSVHREQDAIKQLQAALPVAANDAVLQVDIYRVLAIAYNQANDTDNARVAFKKAVEANGRLSNPGFAPGLEYAEFLITEGEEEAAGSILQTLLQRYPAVATAHYDMARVLAHAHENERAIQEAELALKYTPTVDEQKPIHIFLTKVLHAAGRDQDARLHEEWMNAHPTSPASADAH